MKKTNKHRSSKLRLSNETVRNLSSSELMNAEGGSTTHQGSSLHVTQPSPTITLPNPIVTR